MPIDIAAADLDACAPLLGALTRLNNAHSVELSWADESRLRMLVANAFSAMRIGAADAMLIAFDQAAAYDSENFLWFRARYRTFVYIDRVVTAPAARGRGHARALYRELIARARRAGHHRIVCEINADPPNPASEAFHRSMGFRQVGTAHLRNGKTVGYFGLALGDGEPALDAPG